MGLRDVQAFLRPPDADLVRLVPAGRRWVAFSGERGGEGPLTLGQRNTLPWIVNTTDYNRMTESVLQLPAGASLDDIAAAFGVLMARHESLRTTYPAGGEPVQRVARSGELAIDIYEADGPDSDPLVLSAALARRLRATEFDLAGELPVRVAAATRQGLPLAATALYSHIAADFASMAILGGEFSRLAADPASRSPGPRGHQPLDRAIYEHSAHGKRKAQVALRNMTEQLRRVPQCMFPVPPDPAVTDTALTAADTAAPSAGPLSGWLSSPAAALALPHIAARTGASPRAAVLAALSAVLARRAGHERAVLTALVDIRHEPRLSGYVGSAARDGIISVDVGAAGFDELVWRAAMAVLKAGRHGLADHAAVWAAREQIECERGVAYARDCVYNDISGARPSTRPQAEPGDPAAAAGALRRSRIWWTTPPGLYELLLFIVVQIDGDLVLGVLTADSSRAPRGELELLLRGTERLLVAAAAGDVSLDRAGRITGVEPVVRGSGWLRVDHCWIELPEVQRLLDDALPGSAARVFAAADARGQPALVAYLTPAGGIAGPEQAHLACMALLPRHGLPYPPGGARFTAITPGRYVICRRPPGDPGDLAAWQRQPVLAQGTGRPKP
jgi:hypothetical protein